MSFNLSNELLDFVYLLSSSDSEMDNDGIFDDQDEAGPLEFHDSPNSVEEVAGEEEEEQEVEQEEQEEEGLFVDGRHDIDPADAEYIPRWSSPEDNYFENNQLLGQVRRGGNAENQRDELVEVEMNMRAELPDVGERAERAPQLSRRQGQAEIRAQQPEVIDLTGDNETPPRPTFRQRTLNERRRQSQQRTPPRLARSDAGYMHTATVIDLVSDSDDEPAIVQPNIRHNPPHNHRAHRAHPYAAPRAPQRPQSPPPGAFPPNAFQQINRLIQQIPIFRMMNQGPGHIRDNHDDELVLIGDRHLAGNAFAGRAGPDMPPVRLDYIAHPFAHQQPMGQGGASPRPAHDPPKEAREGFTRSTGEDVVAICPSCDQELAYNPDGDDDTLSAPAKKPRTKKDKAEHHFWVVKACGHVSIHDTDYYD